MARLSRNLLAGMTTMALLSVCVGLVFTWSGMNSTFSLAQDNQPANYSPAELARIDDLSSAFRQVAQDLRPSVVSIQSVKRIQAARGGSGARPQRPDEFRRFFGDDSLEKFFDNRNPQGGSSRSFAQRGTGTGIIVSEDGYLLTNNHVVRDADEVTARLHDGRTFDAQVVGTDAKTDVAVLRINATGLRAARLGNSDDVEVGDWVLAIGSPFELDQTVTAGIISAKGRANVGITDYENFLQTDAAINPGNSGGPLVNMRGQVVGINTAIASRTGSNNGIGFAIPSNMVRMVKNSIVEHGRVERGRLGALIQDLNEDLASSFSYDSTKGVLVGDVLPDSPATKAGLQAGDIVLTYNGRPATSASQLRNAVAATKPGTQTDLEIFRDGRRRSMKVVVGQLEEEEVTLAANLRREEPAVENFGMRVTSLSAEQARRLGFAAGQQGALVTKVEPGTLAAESGIRVGDVIVSVEGRPVVDDTSFQNAVETQDASQGMRIQVKRDGVRRFVFLNGDR